MIISSGSVVLTAGEVFCRKVPLPSRLHRSPNLRGTTHHLAIGKLPSVCSLAWFAVVAALADLCGVPANRCSGNLNNRNGAVCLFNAGDASGRIGNGANDGATLGSRRANVDRWRSMAVERLRCGGAFCSRDHNRLQSISLARVFQS